MALLEVIKYEGNNDVFVWKHPAEDFNTHSQLIVHESQEAIFFKDGQALDLFGPGRHTLTTQNIPLLNKLINLPTGGTSAFHCEVYFFNKVEQMAIKWGTDTRVQYVEPTYGFPLSIGASGEMAISIADSRKLLLKIVGTEKVLDRAHLVTLFRAFLMTRVKTYIAQIMKVAQISIFEIDARLEEFSAGLHQRLLADFEEYGLNLKQFFVTNVSRPEGDPQYERFKDLHFRQYADIAEAQLQQRVGIIEQETKARQMVIEAQGLAQKRQTEGYTYQQERGFDVAEKVAANEASGNMTNLGIGLGMMTGVGGTVGGMVGGVLKDTLGSTNIAPDTSSQQNLFCDQCGAKIEPGAAFCEECGASLNPFGVCSQCGFKFLKPGKFCPKCGTKRE